MPLHQLCSSAGSSKASALPSNAPILPSTHTQEIYDVQWKRPMERCSSQTSTLSFSKDICRICHCEADDEMPLIAPCFCAGSLRYVHQACLQQWIKSSNTKCCELCKFAFIMHSKVKPFSKWERLDMTGIERRKIMCSVAFHAIAITCVVWSLYVLIQRTSQEVQNGELEWPFWTKLVVVAIGFTGSIVFMYVQCKMYIHLCRRWRAFNRVIYVQNAPEKIPLSDSEKIPLKVDSSGQTQLNQEADMSSFIGVAVIPCTTSLLLQPSIILSSTNSTSDGGYCTTSSSPPGALWADEPSSPELGTYPSKLNSGVLHSRRGAVETETLIGCSEAPTDEPRDYGYTAWENFRYTNTFRRLVKTLGREVQEELSKKSLMEPRIIHIANDSLQMRADLSSHISEVETLSLDAH